mgnify:CR=1 FL=1
MFGVVSLNEEQQDSIRQSIKSQRLHRSIYTKNLEECEQGDVRHLPSLDEIHGADQQDHWSRWLNSDQYLSLTPAFPSMGIYEFDHQLDLDATAIHSDTLKVLMRAMRVHMAPQYHLFSTKIKHKYQGILLHTRVNVEIG